MKGKDYFFIGMRKRTSSFLKLEWVHGASSFNIKGMRDGTDTFLKGTLTTLYIDIIFLI